jgi:pimeloyl-ACP methyl ester carboxylesterase
MLFIVDAWNDWIEASSKSPALDDRPSAHLKSKLSYWGSSYGSLLGITFAALYPDRVGRMALDAIVNANYYVAQSGLMHSQTPKPF